MCTIAHMEISIGMQMGLAHYGELHHEMEIVMLPL